MAQQPPPAEQQLHPPSEQQQPPPDDLGLPPPPVHDPRKRLPPPPPRYQLLKLAGPRFAPVQRCLKDIPIAQFDICDKGRLDDRFLEVHWTLANMATGIGPGTYYNVPITCHPNPVNTHIPLASISDNEPETFKICGHSHHIIELFDSGARDGLKVQLLLQDFSNYQTAFRVQLHKGAEWTPFFHTYDQILPAFLESEVLGISGSHDEIIQIGGYETLSEMLRGFGSYPELRGAEATDKKKDKKKITETIRRPFLLSVHYFPEAMRDRFLLIELARRMKDKAPASPLWYRIQVPSTKGNELQVPSPKGYELQVPSPKGYELQVPSPKGYELQVPSPKGYELQYLTPAQVWNRYHKHSSFSSLVLRTGHKDMGNGELEGQLPDNYENAYGISCFEQVIGKYGLMQRIMWKEEVLGMTVHDVEASIEEARAIRDPGFTDRHGKIIKYIQDPDTIVYLD